MIDVPDILFHTIPPAAVGVSMGFATAAGFQSLGTPAAVGVALCAVLGTFCVSAIWIPREWKQHGGRFGGVQSKLEAFIPLMVGPLFLVGSFLLFTYNPV